MGLPGTLRHSGSLVPIPTNCLLSQFHAFSERIGQDERISVTVSFFTFAEVRVMSTCRLR